MPTISFNGLAANSRKTSTWARPCDQRRRAGVFETQRFGPVDTYCQATGLAADPTVRDLLEAGTTRASFTGPLRAAGLTWIMQHNPGGNRFVFPDLCVGRGRRGRFWTAYPSWTSM